MKHSTKDKFAGSLHKVNGTIKEAIGQVADNSQLIAEGRAEKLTGKLQQKAGQVKAVFEK